MIQKNGNNLQENKINSQDYTNDRDNALLEQDYSIQEEMIHLELKTIQDIITLYMPASFKKMLPSLARITYPSNFRPTVIYCNEKADVDICFHMITLQIKKDRIDLPSLIEKIRNNVEEEHHVKCSSASFLPESNGWYFSFRLLSKDCDIYHNYLLIKFKDQLVMIIFHCPFVVYEEWETAVFEMWKSVRERKDRRK